MSGGLRLKLADLACAQLDLSTQSVPPTVLRFEEISEGCGDLEFADGLTRLAGIAIKKLLATLELPLGSGRLFTEEPATISHVTCEGRIRNGFAGELRASVLESESVCLELDSVTSRAHLIAEGLNVKLDGRGGRIQVGTLTLQNAVVTLSELAIHIGSITVSGLKVGWDSGEFHVDAIKAHARGLRIERGPALIQIAAIDLPEGLRVHERVEIREVLVGAIEISVSELRREDFPTIPPEDIEGEGQSKPRRKSRIKLDHGVFETVNGQLDVDASMSMTLPVIGKRDSRHHFRIPVEGGIIDYRDFERGLSDLEDAFIDIRVRGQDLVIERDIPLIPGLQKPIVLWSLSPGDVVLANKQLVRLATLPNYKFASERERDDSDDERGKKSKVRLHRLDFDNIAVHLSLDETAVLSSGEGSLRAHIDELDLAGSLHFHPDFDDEVKPTVLGAVGKGLGTVASKLIVFGHELSARLTIGRLESLEIAFHELRPKTFGLALKNVAIQDVDFDLELAE